MPFPTLLYTSPTAYTVGDYVRVPFQESTITALVIAIHDLATVRSVIRTLPYKIRGDVSMITTQLIPAPIMRTLLDYSRTHEIHVQSFLSQLFVDEAPIFTTLQTEHCTVSGFTGSMAARAHNYQQRIEQHSPTLLVSPDIRYARALYSHLSAVQMITTLPQLHKTPFTEGISITTVNMLPRILQRITQGPAQPVIIFDSILAPQYHVRDRTGDFFGRAQLFINFCTWMGVPVIVGDELLPFGDYELLWNNSTPLIIPAPDIASLAVQTKHKRSRTLEQYHLQKLAEYAHKGKRILIYSNQRDLFGYVSCPKCSYIERCATCNSILRLGMTNSRHVLQCTTCNTNTPAHDICTGCGGITLELRRRGVDGYVQVLSELSSDIPLYALNRDTKKVQHLFQEWQSTGGVLVATSSIFDHPAIAADITYIAPHSWTRINDTPEQTLWEYLWLANRSQSTLSLPITREILTQSANTDTIDITARARHEWQSAQALGVQIPCTLWRDMVD